MEKIYQTLVSLPDFTPSPFVNETFSMLVAKVSEPELKHNLNGGQVVKLRKICSSAEYELEKQVALKIISSSNSHATLVDFVYYKNYNDLVAL